MLLTDKDWYVYKGNTYCPPCAKGHWEVSGDFAHSAIKISRIMTDNIQNNFICCKYNANYCLGSTELVRIAEKI